MFVIAAAACGGDDDDEDSGGVTSVTLMLPVQDVIQFHSLYLADELGYFEDEDLDVTFEVADGSSAAVQQLVAGNADAALPAPSAFLQAVAQGQDLRWVYSYQFSNIFDLATPADSDIESIEDLEGRKLGISELSGGEVPLVRGVLREAGLQEGEDVELVPVGEGSALTVEALESGEVDAYSSSLPDIAAIELAGIDMTTILPEEAADFPADGLVVTAEYLESNTDAVEGLARAITQATVYADANRDAAFELASEIAPEEFEDEEFAQRAWDVAVDLRTPPPELADEPTGSLDREAWQTYHDFLAEGSEEEGGLRQPVELDSVLDDAVLEDANDFDREAIADEANKAGS
jgi:NitT/TauT family transport system substrate-binding protein